MKCFHIFEVGIKEEKIPCIQRVFHQRLDLKPLLFVSAIILWFQNYYHVYLFLSNCFLLFFFQIFSGLLTTTLLDFRLEHFK